MTVEMLLNEPTFERVVLFYKPQLERLGIAVTIRTVEEAQYENRLRRWDFDMIIHSWGESLSPGNEQRDHWGSPAADQTGSQNYAGIKNPAVDALTARGIFTKNRAELVAAPNPRHRARLWTHYSRPRWAYRNLPT